MEMEVEKKEWEFLAACVVKTVKDKNKQYGSAFRKVSEILSVLYPYGILPEQYDDAALLIRVLDKICRIANTNDEEVKKDAWLDICGYALLRLGDLNGIESEEL